MNGRCSGSGDFRAGGQDTSLCRRSTIPLEINHAVLTGRLGADPEEGYGPSGDPVKLLWIEFPVIDPDRPPSLWRHATCLIEVPIGCSAGDVEELRGGAPILVAGQISDRWVIEGGDTSRRGVIVASQIKVGAPPEGSGFHV